MKVVTVHRGARDNYQVARALSEAGMLETLVTDLYWPADHSWARAVERAVPVRVADALRRRYAESVPSKSVRCCWESGLYSTALSKSTRVPFSRLRDAVRRCDRTLGRRAGEIATRRGAALLSYSYYGHSAFSHYSGNQPRILFQLHPHPRKVRDILWRELVLHPEYASSLDKEWELALPDEDLNRLIEESGMAEQLLAASSFTKQTLIEAGINPRNIHVIPYGTDLPRFTWNRQNRSAHQRLRLLFVGTLSQRKGIKYLLDAVNAFPAGSVELTVCGRQVDNLDSFWQSRVPVRVLPSISAQGLLDAYRSADLFVFPSLAEGFGHVLLEAMASGLPIISTTSTAAPDLIRGGEEGFVIEPGSVPQLTDSIEYFLRHPEKILSMGSAARRRAEHFTWERFRSRVTEVISGILEPTEALVAVDHV
jgi:glycosyltransferase involved in cell wall biosynthesis